MPKMIINIHKLDIKDITGDDVSPVVVRNLLDAVRNGFVLPNDTIWPTEWKESEYLEWLKWRENSFNYQEGAEK